MRQYESVNSKITTPSQGLLARKSVAVTDATRFDGSAVRSPAILSPARHEGLPADTARRQGMRLDVSVPGVHRPFTALATLACKSTPPSFHSVVSLALHSSFARVNRRPTGSFGPLGRRTLSILLPSSLLVETRPVVFQGTFLSVDPPCRNRGRNFDSQARVEKNISLTVPRNYIDKTK